MSDFQSLLNRMNTTVQSGQGAKRAERRVCKQCGQAILTSKEIVTTAGDVFHPEHFLCSSCHKALSTDAHYPYNGEYFCPACWESRCPFVCEKCGKAIISGQKITALGKYYHPDHFRCTECDCLLTETFAVRDGLPYCQAHAQANALTCARCKKPISRGQYFNNQDGTRHWHADCFCCASCKMPFINGDHCELNGEVYCKLHYHAMKGTLCAGCGLPIVGDALQSGDSFWHIDCLKCASCNTPLKGASYVMMEGKPHCKDCALRIDAARNN